MDTERIDNSLPGRSISDWSKTVSDKNTNSGPALAATQALVQKRNNPPAPIRVYSAAGAVQVGARAVTSSTQHKPAWHRDDIDYDSYQFE